MKGRVLLHSKPRQARSKSSAADDFTNSSLDSFLSIFVARNIVINCAAKLFNSPAANTSEWLARMRSTSVVPVRRHSQNEDGFTCLALPITSGHRRKHSCLNVLPYCVNSLDVALNDRISSACGADSIQPCLGDSNDRCDLAPRSSSSLASGVSRTCTSPRSSSIPFSSNPSSSAT